MTRVTLYRLALAGALAGGLAACGGQADAGPPERQGAVAAGAADMEGMAGHGMEGMAGHAMGGAAHADPAMMHRHATEADAMVAAMREHLQQMRRLGPEQWHARMGEHVSGVARMLSTMDRHMREMDMGMGMDDEHLGQMMGMSAEDHRRMMEEMQELRSQLEQLQTAEAAEVRQRTPAHLDHLERLVGRMEQSAAHMHAMH
jgi:FtsZ-binding cell division protein ZapB